MYYVSIIKNGCAITTFYGLSFDQAYSFCENLNKKRSDLFGGIAFMYCDDSNSEYANGVPVGM